MKVAETEEIAEPVEEKKMLQAWRNFFSAKAVSLLYRIYILPPMFQKMTE